MQEWRTMQGLCCYCSVVLLSVLLQVTEWFSHVSALKCCVFKGERNSNGVILSMVLNRDKLLWTTRSRSNVMALPLMSFLCDCVSLSQGLYSQGYLDILNTIAHKLHMSSAAETEISICHLERSSDSARANFILKIQRPDCVRKLLRQMLFDEVFCITCLL